MIDKDGLERFVVNMSDLALEMVKAHEAHLANFDPNSPRKFQTEFAKAVRGLDFMPQRYSRVYDDDETMGEMRKAWFYHNRYAVIFRIKGDTVTVEYVIDGRQDNSWLFDL